MKGPFDVPGDELLSIIERIEQIEAEIGELAEAKREIFLEAKGNGYDLKILREVIRIRKQDPKERDEQESLLDVYWEAIKKASRTAKSQQQKPSATNPRLVGSPAKADENIRSSSVPETTPLGPEHSVQERAG